MRGDAILIQRIKWRRMIDSGAAPLGFDCFAPATSSRLFQQYRHISALALPGLECRYRPKAGVWAQPPAAINEFTA
jgi:hypothetical protein